MRLTARGLVCLRGGREVFRNLGFAVGSGEMLLVTGPNGAGKSSLLRLITGLLRPAAGAVELAGGDPELSIAEQVHYLGHQDALKPALTAEENLAFWTDLLRAGPKEPALAAVGLERLGRLPVLYLSAGQRRRLCLARLIAVPRPIWLLDEPTASLDAAAQAMLAGLMRGHLADGGLIIAATHAPMGVEGAQELKLGGPSP
jgi:heme exporter protein A